MGGRGGKEEEEEEEQQQQQQQQEQQQEQDQHECNCAGSYDAGGAPPPAMRPLAAVRRPGTGWLAAVAVFCPWHRRARPDHPAGTA